MTVMSIRELLEFLDGDGIIFTDEELVSEVLKCFDATLDSIVKLDDEELEIDYS